MQIQQQNRNGDSLHSADMGPFESFSSTIEEQAGNFVIGRNGVQESPANFCQRQLLAETKHMYQNVWQMIYMCNINSNMYQLSSSCRVTRTPF